MDVKPALPDSHRTDDPQEQYRAAVRHHREGRYQSAREAYCCALEIDPEHADAWFMLGSLLLQLSSTDDAIACLERAVVLRPRHSGQLNNLGLAYRSCGRLADAELSVKMSIELDPDNIETLNSLGVIQLESSRPDEAATTFRRVLHSSPGHGLALTNLGNALQKMGRHRDALHCHERALANNRRSVILLTNLASAQHAMGDLTLARDVLREAVTQDPNSEDAAVAFGRVHFDLRNYARAREVLEAVTARPGGSAGGEYYLARTLDALGEYDEALRRFRRAVKLRPDYSHALVYLGFNLLRRGQASPAMECLRKAVSSAPDDSDVYSSFLFGASLDPTLTPAERRDLHVEWAERFCRVERVTTNVAPVKGLQPIRIGYLSPDFRHHAVMYYFLPMLEHFDRSQFEIYCYGEVRHGDEFTERVRSLATHWRSTCGWSDQQVAELIAEDRINILVDLAGHTSKSRVRTLAYKPAPLQLTWLGYPHTTGLSAVDYYITNQTQDPPGDLFHVEAPIYLDRDTCFNAPQDAPEVTPLPCAHRGYVTFGSLHRHQKISRAVLTLWSRVLKAVPDSRLLLFNTNMTRDVCEHLAKCLTEEEIDSSRFSIMTKHDGNHYLSIYREVDIALDVFPWSGGTTTREALWMGVPVLGLLGDQRSSRSTAAALTQVGHGELVSRDWDAYVRLARDLSRDIERLQRLRCGLRDDMRRTLCDAEGFTRVLEEKWIQLWQTWCSHQGTRRPHALGSALKTSPVVTDGMQCDARLGIEADHG